jgi:single-strand DNA-binding protein
MASRSVNRVFLVGSLGKDAETKFAPSGVAKTTFSVATNRRWKDQSGEWKEETDWHSVVLWRSENLANYLLKGKQVHVEGRLSTRSYDDKEGNKRWVTEVVADNVILLGGGSRDDSAHSDEQPVSRPRGGSSGAGPQRAPQQTGFEPGVIDDSDVPFILPAPLDALI